MKGLPMITDELRRYASGFAGILGVTTAATTTDVKDDLEEIADRIDAALANYIQLPKDADGETIHLGDELEEGKVARIVLTDSDWEPSVYVYKLPNVMREYFCSDVDHAKPDSWERIISEFAERVLRSGHQWGLDAPAATAEFVERCKRLAGDAK